MTAFAPRAAPAISCALLLLATACRPAGTPAGDDDRALRDVVVRYEAASNEGDAVALAALYADDALLLPPDGEMVSGRAAILEFWQDGIEPGISFEVVGSRSTGGSGYVVGRFLVEATETAPADSGKYVLCLQRQRDGGWLVVADIWNATPSADETDDEEGHDPRTRVTRAAYHFRTMDHMATKRSTVLPQPTTLHRVNTAFRNSSRERSSRSMRH
jgi:ketosteroid isomerase-like protein